MTVQAGSVTVPHTFTAGSPAVAAEVNANFSAVETAVDDNDARIAALEAALASLQGTVTAQAATITSLQATVTAQAATTTDLQTTVTAQATTIEALDAEISGLTENSVLGLSPYLVITSDSRGPLVRFQGVNVQIVNGEGSTQTANGTGNLIVGYDEADTSGTYYCTIGTNPTTGTQVTDAITCTNAGGTWIHASMKSGSHYIVAGSQNNYSRWGGVVFGFRNISNYDYASVTGGTNNRASGLNSSISGGASNFARGVESSVSGGLGNFATGNGSSVSGGGNNAASGQSSSVSGGNGNTASAYYSSVSGGEGNTASGSASSVSGGDDNTASGPRSSVSGGFDNTASGSESSVSGGYDCETGSTDYRWVVGTRTGGCSPTLGN